MKGKEAAAAARRRVQELEDQLEVQRATSAKQLAVVNTELVATKTALAQVEGRLVRTVKSEAEAHAATLVAAAEQRENEQRDLVAKQEARAREAEVEVSRLAATTVLHLQRCKDWCTEDPGGRAMALTEVARWCTLDPDITIPKWARSGSFVAHAVGADRLDIDMSYFSRVIAESSYFSATS